MNLLLDTNALVWVADHEKADLLGKQARKLIETSDIVYLSVISLVELQIKVMTGKLRVAASIADSAVDNGLAMLDLRAAHVGGLAKFPDLIRHDPFDRLLLAQAEAEGLHFLTADKLLLGLKLPFIVDARQ